MGKSKFGTIAEFKDPATLLQAAEKVRENGFTQWDTYSPFPIHGMDQAMGLKASPLGWYTLGFFLAGFSGVYFLEWWSSSIAYPMVISGKPLHSFPAFIPVALEIGILLSAFGTVIGMFQLNKMPEWYHALFTSNNFKKATDDGFFISIESTDPLYESEKVSSFLSSIGGNNIEVIEEPA